MTKMKTICYKIYKAVKEALGELRLTLIFTILFVLFSDFIFNNYYNFIIEPILSRASNGILADVIFFLVAISALFSVYKKIDKGYYVKLSQACFCMIVIAIYLYFRITKLDIFLSFYLVAWLKYFDAIMLYFLVPILLKLLQYLMQKKEKQQPSSMLLTDSYIKSGEQDLLERKYKARRLYKVIKELSSNESVAIGIVGEWGSGKTSFLNLVKEAFLENNNDDNIIIDFNPWLNISLDSIIKDYFNTLETVLKDSSVDISRNIKKYGNSVLKIHSNSFTDALLKGSNLLFEKNLTDEFKSLNELLKKLNKRVIIFIDDFDRLQANEIFEILKLIRNTGGFDTFTYVVAYDKEYLIKSLENYNIPNPHKFSEKIFLKEVELLPITNFQINSYLSRELVNRFKDKQVEIDDFFNNDINRYAPIGAVKKSTWALKNLRDVKRFLNSFVVDYNDIKDEVLFRDYLIVKLIKFKFYNVYTLLFSYKDDFLKKEDYSSSGNRNLKYVLKSIDDSNRDNIYNAFKGTKLQEYVKNNFEYSEDDLNSVSALFNSLFTSLSSLKNNLSFCYEINYYRYFKDELDSTALSIVEFKRVMSLSFDEIKKELDRWYTQGKLDNVNYFLNDTNMVELNSRDEYENYIKTMFQIANYKTLDAGGRQRLFGFDVGILWRNLSNSRNRLVEKFYNNVNELKSFVTSILDSASPPFDYESTFMYFLTERIDIDSDVIDKEAVYKYLIYYFKTYSESMNKTDYHFWTLLYRCKLIKYTSSGGGGYVKKESYLDEAVDIFKGVMKRNLDRMLVIFIDPQPFYGDGKDDFHIGLDPICASIFGSLDNFLAYIKSPEIKENLSVPTEFLEEFTTFAETAIKAKKKIKFDFNYIGVNEKLNRIVDRQNYK